MGADYSFYSFYDLGYNKYNKMSKLLEIIKIIFAIIAIILSLIVIILIITRLSGHSPDNLTILLWINGVMFTLQIFIITVLVQIKEDIGNLKEFKRQTIQEIKNIKEKII